MPTDRLRIGLIAPPWTSVPPAGYGGTEAVVDELARGLSRLGHDVVLATTGDSTCPVSRVWWHERPATPMGNTVDEVAHVQAAYAALSDCDVIHDHTVVGPAWGHAYGPTGPVQVVTNHGEYTPQLAAVFARYAKHAAIVAISHDQARHAAPIPIEAVIHHGLDLSTRPCGSGSGGYAMFVGRMDPTKGVDRAIRIARAAGVPLLIAAKMREPTEREFYATEIVPLLGRDISYLGEITPTERDALLADAVALLNPIAWPEPFGLVMIEALAVGTPVIAFRSGSVEEIVEDGVTGFVCDDELSAVAALSDAARLDRRACRSTVRRRFSTARMVSAHEVLYQRLLLKQRRPFARPVVIDLAVASRARPPAQRAHAR